MTFDWNHFTPWASLAGGILLGLASAIFILFNGRILGISGILGGMLMGRSGCWPHLWFTGCSPHP
jgi:uncharacterized membrane protein SpoIIM required for sporulation